MDKEEIEKLASANALRVLLWIPAPYLQLVAQRGNGPTIRLDADGDAAKQVKDELPRLHAWLSENPQQDASIVSTRQAQPNQGGCGGCQANAFRYMVDTFNSGIGLAKFVGQMAVGIKATQEDHDKRKAACEGCQAIAPDGQRMYRQAQGESHSCGIPRLQDILRNESVDGCGCWLEAKWWGRDEKCPLGKW